MKHWRDTIQWAEGRPHPICPGDLQHVIRDLLSVIRVLGESHEALEARVLELEAKTQRPTAYERVLGS